DGEPRRRPLLACLRQPPHPGVTSVDPDTHLTVFGVLPRGQDTRGHGERLAGVETTHGETLPADDHTSAVDDVSVAAQHRVRLQSRLCGDHLVAVAALALQ